MSSDPVFCSEAAPFDDARIARIARGLLDLSHPYAEWSHAAHFAAALWLLRHPEVLAAEGGMEPILRRYNKAVGVPDIPTRGYHHTITLASMRAAAAFLGAHGPDASLAEVFARLLRAEPGNRGWLLAYWSEQRLMSLEARRTWIEPDLKPLPYPERAP